MEGTGIGHGLEGSGGLTGSRPPGLQARGTLLAGAMAGAVVQGGEVGGQVTGDLIGPGHGSHSLGQAALETLVEDGAGQRVGDHAPPGAARCQHTGHDGRHGCAAPADGDTRLPAPPGVAATGLLAATGLFTIRGTTIPSAGVLTARVLGTRVLGTGVPSSTGTGAASRMIRGRVVLTSAGFPPPGSPPASGAQGVVGPPPLPDAAPAALAGRDSRQAVCCAPRSTPRLMATSASARSRGETARVPVRAGAGGAR